MDGSQDRDSKVLPETQRASGHGYEERGLKVPPGNFTGTGRFGRMFPALMPLASFTPGPVALGAAGGPMDGGSPPPNDTTQNNPRIRAGYTFLGQFIDHDLTLDAVSILERQIDLNAIHNFRTPAFELDSLYGLGPSAQPYLYQPDGMRFQLSPGDLDLQRNVNGRALIGDPRNDENLIVSQLHLLFLKFHNAVVDQATDPSLGAGERFLRAQEIVRWHYQWIVAHEFLPRTVGKAIAERALEDLPFTYPADAFMPVEFSVAAYRFGHSQTRPGYLINNDNGQVAAAALFPPDPTAPVGPGDLRGFKPVAPERRVDWKFFFGPQNTTPNPLAGAQDSKLIDTRLSTAMLRLPDGVVPPTTPDAHRSLATRNLQRGIDAQLPSGQQVACKVVPLRDRLTERQVWGANDMGAAVPGGAGGAPLWFYVLREAEVKARGLRLAGAGAEIVARTFAALLHADPASQVNRDPHWTPSLGSGSKFTMSDLVNFTEGRTGAAALASEDVDALPDA
jgi:hypothetical protein